jgi:hypothetical protein
VDAVHSRADHHPVAFVQEERDVVRVDPVDGERKDARTERGVLRSEEVEARLVLERRRHPGVRGPLPTLDLLEAHAPQEVDGRMRSDRSGVVLEPGLEPVRRGTQLVVGERAPLDGLAAD